MSIDATTTKALVVRKDLADSGAISP